MKPIQTLELFGGIGAPRVALRNIGVPVKAIDYVEIDEKAVRSYNAMFENDLSYKPQDIVGWNLKPDILIHGSPCQSVSKIGKRTGADKGSGTPSSLMWETIRIVKNLGRWKPKFIVWENVKGVLSKVMNDNFKLYIEEMDKMGYTTSYEILDAREFGLPQYRERVFTISILGDHKFDFSQLQRKPMNDISDYIQDYSEIDDRYDIVSPSMISKITEQSLSGKITNFHTLPVINEYAYTITTKQDRCPNSGIIPIPDSNRYRLLTELECWRLQGFSDEDYFSALKANPGLNGKKNHALYKQAGNSMPVPVLESIFKLMLSDMCRAS